MECCPDGRKQVVRVLRGDAKVNGVVCRVSIRSDLTRVILEGRDAPNARNTDQPSHGLTGRTHEARIGDGEGITVEDDDQTARLPAEDSLQSERGALRFERQICVPPG